MMQEWPQNSRIVRKSTISSLSWAILDSTLCIEWPVRFGKIRGGPPRRLRDDLNCGAPFRPFFRMEMLQLKPVISDRYGTLLNLDQILLIPEFARKHHRVSYAHLIQTEKIHALLKAIDSAKIISIQPWPPGLWQCQKGSTQVRSSTANSAGDGCCRNTLKRAT